MFDNVCEIPPLMLNQILQDKILSEFKENVFKVHGKEGHHIVILGRPIFMCINPLMQMLQESVPDHFGTLCINVLNKLAVSMKMNLDPLCNMEIVTFQLHSRKNRREYFRKIQLFFILLRKENAKRLWSSSNKVLLVSQVLLHHTVT